MKRRCSFNMAEVKTNTVHTYANVCMCVCCYQSGKVSVFCHVMKFITGLTQMHSVFICQTNDLLNNDYCKAAFMAIDKRERKEKMKKKDEHSRSKSAPTVIHCLHTLQCIIRATEQHAMQPLDIVLQLCNILSSINHIVLHFLA